MYESSNEWATPRGGESGIYPFTFRPNPIWNDAIGSRIYKIKILSH